MLENGVADKILNNIYGRRSIRRYRPDPVPESALEAVLKAAIWAPSAHNRQPWRFAVIKKLSTKRKLAVDMGQSLRRDLENDGASADFIQKDIDRSYDRITRAPVLILLCITLISMDKYSDQKRNNYEKIMAIQSAAMAGQNLLLCAHALGLAACWMCAPLFCPEVVVETLGLSPDWQPQGLITLGYPAETRNKDRADLSSKWSYIE